MIHDPATAGPHRPADPTPDRKAGSVRRTSSIDTSRPFGMTGEMVMDHDPLDYIDPLGQDYFNPGAWAAGIEHGIKSAVESAGNEAEQFVHKLQATLEPAGSSAAGNLAQFGGCALAQILQ